MFRRDPSADALKRASALLGRDLTHLQPLLRLAMARGGLLAVSQAGRRLAVPLGGVPEGGAFELASVTKSLTAALTSALVQAGHLDWTTPLRRLGGPLRALPRTLTARALATHTAGLPMHPARTALTTLTHYHDPYGSLSAGAALASAARWANARQAGRFVYSNLGMGVLALACAHVAGESLSAAGYDRALRTWVTGPLGLQQTGLLPQAPVVTPAGWLGPGTLTRFGPLVGAGGLFGTAADLLTFGEAHLSGRAGLHWTDVQRVPGLPPVLTGVAPGWMVSGTARWHDGVARGTRAGLGFDPEQGVVVALLLRGGVPLLGARGAGPLLLRALLGVPGETGSSRAARA
ncbi:serine hydrolase domain-containing protein [Deinococcus hohokamensis]|uniref:Serine hydrolase domain-containing protein n=1 Tax=Deinococcus hohokamensis TaxID=309883 RepID=A0ABV9I9G8_9DEIO